MNLLAAITYDPGTAVSKATTSLLAMTALDTTNLRSTVTVPASGIIQWKIQSTLHGATTYPQVLLGVLDGATVRGRKAAMLAGGNLAATTVCACWAEGMITGLTPGASITLDAAYGVETVVASTGLKYGGPNNTTGNDAWGAISFELWDPRPLPTATPGAANGVLIAGSNAATTLASLTCTGAWTVSDGVILTASTLNRSAFSATGNGTAAGVTAIGGATGNGVTAVGGATSGDGFRAAANGAGSGHGFRAVGIGTSRHGIFAEGGATTSDGIRGAGGGAGHGISGVSGTGATGDGFRGTALSTNGNGMGLVGVGTGDGLLATGGASAGGDGIAGVAGGGVDIRGSITGNLSGSVGSVTGLTAANLDVAVSTRASQASLDTVDDFLDTEVAAIKAKTDGLNFTGSAVDANITAVNDITIDGAGTAGDPWGPA
jgi:hypothetical protein